MRFNFKNVAETLVLFFARFSVGGVLLWSGYYKINHPYDFLGSVYKYEFTNAQFGLLIAAALPWIEITLAICLLVRVMLGASMTACVVLLAFFVALQISALCRGLSISCGCFGGSGGELVSYYTILRGSGLLLLAIAGCAGLARIRMKSGEKATAFV